MEVYGFFVPGIFIGIALGVILPILANKASAKEEDGNDRFPTPTPHQVAWHIRHARQDLRLIALLLVAILLTLWIKL